WGDHTFHFMKSEALRDLVSYVYARDEGEDAPATIWYSQAFAAAKDVALQAANDMDAATAARLAGIAAEDPVAIATAETAFAAAQVRARDAMQAMVSSQNQLSEAYPGLNTEADAARVQIADAIDAAAPQDTSFVQKFLALFGLDTKT